MPTLDRLLDRFPGSASLLLGVVAAAGFPPFKLWPMALLAMGLAVFHLTNTDSRRGALLRGWLFGIGHFTATNAWIAEAFTHQSEMPAFLGWLAVPLLSLYLAIFPGLAAIGTRALVRRSDRPLGLVMSFAALWIVTEWLRSWVFTGYAWGPFGLAFLGFDDRPGLAMLLPWLGTYAFSGLAVILAGLLVLWLRARRFVPALILVIGTAVMMYLPAGPRDEGTQAYVIAQPDFDQQDITDPRLYERAFVTITGLSERRPGEDGKRIVFWPESGLPDYLRDGYPQRYYRATTAGGDPAYARRRIGTMMGPDTVLLTGAVDLEVRGDRAVAAYNVVTALDERGRIVGSYRKAHLVPYGEYLPMRQLLEPLGLSRLVAGTIEFWEGPGPRTIGLGAYGRVGMQICYEIVFSGQVVDRTDRPDVIFNPSNDGWFGAWGPPQQFAQARMRAIEEGLPVVRATTTGISGVIDADGVVRQSLGMGVTDRLTGVLPPAEAPTLFARYGNLLGLAWAALVFLLSLVATRLRRG